MRKIVNIKKYVFLVALLFLLTACTNVKPESEKTIKDDIQENNSIDYDIFPEEYRELWETSGFTSSLPPKDELVRIDLCRYVIRDDAGYGRIYGKILIEEEKAIFEGNVIDSQEYKLSEDDLKNCLDDIDYSCLTDPIKDAGWNIVLVYKDGNHYSYNLFYQRGDSDNPRQEMIKKLFAKIQMDDYAYWIAGF